MRKLSKFICGALIFSMILPHTLVSDRVKAAGGNEVVEVTIDGQDVERAADNVNGLTYKGFGVLSANSTSNLLIDYKYESPYAYGEMLKVLFGGAHPLMNHVKIEMGNDGNNSTGADSCTMRYEDEEADASRSPGFILAADAKKVNEDVKVSILRWEMPSWVQQYWNNDRTGRGYEAMYRWYRETIYDAYEKYGYILDYVNPDKNETGDPDVDFIKWFADRVESEDEFPDYMDDEAIKAYHEMKIVASDEYISLNIVPDMRKDEELYNAVDAIGLHYTTGTAQSTPDYINMADIDDKEVWYSEGCGSFSYSEYQKNKTTAYGAGTIGGYQSPLAMCDCMIKSAVYSRRSHYIFQPAIGSFYEGSQYDHKELLSAREPWSGHIHYDESIYCLSHFTKFAKTGWENSDNTAGIWRIIPEASGNNSSGTEHLTNENGEPSYMTLASPDRKNFSTVIVNNSDRELTYSIGVEGMDIPKGKTLEMWQSSTDSYMQFKGGVECVDEKYMVDIEPFSIVTVTSLDCKGSSEYTDRLPEESYNPVLDTNISGTAQDTASEVLYADDYNYSGYPENYLAERGYEPRYTVDYSGAYVVEDGMMKHVLGSSVSQWQNNTPNAVIGDYRWMNYKAEIDVAMPYGGYSGIVIREQTGLAYTGSGYSLQIKYNGEWTLQKESRRIAGGTVAASDTYRLGLEGRGAHITAYIDGVKVHEFTDDNAQLSGRIRVFNGWDEVHFDNLMVTKVSANDSDNILDVIPYGEALIDNASDKISYEGAWDIAVNGSSNDWYRSTSKSSSAGASFTFDIESDGFMLIGKNDSQSVLDIEIDGKMFDAGAAAGTSGYHCASYVTSGLNREKSGKHTVKVTLKSGTFVLDAVMPVGNIPVNVSSVVMNTGALTLKPGQSASLSAVAGPDTATCRTIRYYSSDENIAVVDGVTGAVTAKAQGKAVIYAASCDGSKKTASCEVTVQSDTQQYNPGTGWQQPQISSPAVSNPNNNTVKKPKAPTIKSVKRKGKKTVIKWKKVSKADGYIIMRSAQKKKGYKKIANIKKGSVTKYTDKKGKKRYFYKICAYKKSPKGTVKGSYSKPKRAGKIN